MVGEAKRLNDLDCKKPTLKRLIATPSDTDSPLRTWLCDCRRTS
jgi:hypothetical protein